MGISQLPATPVPTNKGDIIVGTATGATRLPVGTVANQSLIVDSTTTTGVKWASPQRQWYGYFPLFTSPTSGATSPNTNNMNAKVVYGGGYYAFLSQSFLYYSTDGKNWSFVVFSTTLNTLEVNAAGTVWVVGGNTNSLWSAPNPAGTWTARTSQISGTGAINNIKWIPSYNLFVLTALTNASPWNVISTSPDGITWTGRYAHPSGVGTNSYAIANNFSTTTVVDFDQATPNAVFSTNGTSWTATNANNSAALSGNIIWLPTAGRFQSLTGSQYSQTAANVATAWNTAPTSNYNSLTYPPYSGTGTTTMNVFSPNYDATTGRWYVLYGMNSQAMAMATIDDTNIVLSEFTTGTNNVYLHKIISIEELPYYIGQGSTSLRQGLSYVNNQFFLIHQTDKGFAIWNTIP